MVDARRWLQYFISLEGLIKIAEFVSFGKKFINELHQQKLKFYILNFFNLDSFSGGLHSYPELWQLGCFFPLWLLHYRHGIILDVLTNHPFSPFAWNLCWSSLWQMATWILSVCLHVELLSFILLFVLFWLGTSCTMGIWLGGWFSYSFSGSWIILYAHEV